MPPAPGKWLACLLLLAGCMQMQTAAAQPVPVVYSRQAVDMRNLMERVTYTRVKCVGRYDSDDFNVPERVLGIIMCVLTVALFLFALTYSVVTKGRGNLCRPELPYRPARFIEIDKLTANLASG